MATVSADEDAYQALGEIRDRVDYRGRDFFEENQQLQFDELLVRLEREARGLIETRTGDEPFSAEDGRVDEIRATSDASIPLVYPIRDVKSVEIKRTNGGDWREIKERRWDHTDHRLVLADRPNAMSLRNQQGNALARNAGRATWRDVAQKIRVTYDRGFEEVPGDIKSVQIAIINRSLRNLKREQTVAAASPDEFATATDAETLLTDDIRERIDQITGLGGKTMSV